MTGLFRPAVPLLLALVIPATGYGQGQPMLNPDISFITDVRALAADATGDDVTLEIHHLELGAEAFLNPFARGSIFLGVHAGALEIEEGYVSFTSLPGGLGLRIGQYFMDVGRFNTQHPHVFPFLDYPLFVTEYLGEEAYRDVGVNPSYLLDLGAFPLTLSAGVANGNLAGHPHGEEGDGHDHAPARFRPLQDEEPVEAEDGRTLADLAYHGRASGFFTLAESSFLDVGVSAGTATLDAAEDLRAVWFGGDLKYKWRPNRDRSLTVAGEVHAQRRDVDRHDEEVLATAQVEDHEDTQSFLGAFGFFDYRLKRHWNVGALVDYVEPLEHEGESRLGLGGFVGYSVFEESTVIRMLVRHDDMPGDAGGETRVVAQILFGMGPHKPHQY